MNQQIREFMEKNPTPWRAKKVAEELGLDANLTSIAMAGMRGTGELVGCKVEVPGERTQFEYRIAAASARTKGSMRKWSINGKRRAAGRALTPAADAPKAKRKYRKRRAAKVRRKATKRCPPFAPQWALRADGALLLLGTDLIIPAGAARAFVEFVRATTPGQIQALVDFVGKLDKGQA